jgi:arylformamidase
MKQLEYKTIIDISLTLNNKTIIYPGNPPFEIETFNSATGLSTSSKFSTSTHNGTHIDSPGHAADDGLDIDDLSLSTFIGPCRVIDLTASEVKITVEDLKSKDIQKGERILLKTSNSERGFETFYDDYVYLSGDAALYLASQGVILVGIDALSIKQKGSKDNTPHTALLSRLIPIIEGLDLNHVAEGEYTIIAFPLKINAKDGAPARVVLLA